MPDSGVFAQTTARLEFARDTYTPRISEEFPSSLSNVAASAWRSDRVAARALAPADADALAADQRAAITVAAARERVQLGEIPALLISTTIHPYANGQINGQ